ncbi:methyltransferase [uncultured Shewanella sp.]|uniref:class I SAM-dependent methyltransferase n=1 Tax=uncultured Shewanella sp. TaxID=173975 RepID=UPI002634EA38|nr:methyltransferase [uncultured Shewanella sp.]
MSFSVMSSSESSDMKDPLHNAVQSDFRTSSNIQRDVYRHPFETLNFFGVKPTDTVIELWPGGGWYAEILAPYLNQKGQYVGAIFDSNPTDEAKKNGYRATSAKKFKVWLEDSKTKTSQAEVVTFDPPTHYSLGPNNSADVVLTFRNLHNWAVKDYLLPVFQSAFKVLKPGGTFGVVEHRGKEGMLASSGYMEQDEVIALAKKVGFSLVASSEINANLADTKDYPNGVWSLPPRLKGGDTDKQKYVDIGESDRMTLKFIKPNR